MDLYKETDHLINILKQKGHTEKAKQLSDSIRYSAIGTEILMKIKHHLNEILKTPQNYDETIVSLAKSIENRITNAL